MIEICLILRTESSEMKDTWKNAHHIVVENKLQAM